MRSTLILVGLLLAIAGLPTAVAATQKADPASASVTQQPDIIETAHFAIRGEPKYQEGFRHFDYVNPEAPKGGTIRQYRTGTFDSLNRYGRRGVAARNSDRLYDNLLVGSEDEIGVYYPLIAEKISYASDYSRITFHIDPRARFQDGKPIRARDVQFSFEKFSEEGVPQFKSYFAFVTGVETLDEHRVRFTLEGANREEMAALFGLTILPEHWWKDRNLGEPTLEIPVGSSGFAISEFKSGQYVIYENRKDYWAKDLPSQKGLNNFQFERYDYYRDDIVAFEAFKSGEFDFWQESEAKNWATAYDFPAMTEGKVNKELLPHSIPQPTAGLVFNTKRPQFSDPRVRRALAYMLDFEWMNKALFYDQYVRTKSYFTNTEFRADGLPQGRELEILQSLKGQIPEEVFTEAFEPPSTQGDGNIRQNMRQALRLLKSAGWDLKNQKLVNRETGEPFRFEILAFRPTTEKVAAPFIANLKRIGIEATLRNVDSSQFINRLREHEFDMLESAYTANAYPSSSLKIVWRSNFVDSTWNTANVTDPAIDTLIDGIAVNQENPEELLAYGKALDRTLLWNYYIIPKWHISAYRIAYWKKFARPDTRPKYDLGLATWWFDQGQAEKLGR